MQDAIFWGPFIIKYSYIAFALSALAAYTAMKYWLKDMNEVNTPVLDDITNVSFWSLLVWKFSVVIFNPIQIFNNPYYLLYFNGGERGIWLAAIVALIFLIMKSKKREISGWVYMATVTTGFLTYKLMEALFQLLFSSTTQSIVSDLIPFVITFALLMWLDIKKENFRQPFEMYQLIVWFSIGQILSAFLQDNRAAVFMGLSIEQLIFFILALSCLFLQNFKMKSDFHVSK
ncbi:hypothetical protein [Paenibacillus arenosi]|uniref:Prolipoprotein diacylglyceryl transferase n=1 Tax=Paenibacillus arenosi TaxID=2774142 RepID=A0ABR9AZU3_9BACL|nr:hypothetical protein [Paenibacillus arenosi]MBD8499605.1 hypothetical protein [Paenibacillus arenosi]